MNNSQRALNALCSSPLGIISVAALLMGGAVLFLAFLAAVGIFGLLRDIYQILKTVERNN